MAKRRRAVMRFPALSPELDEYPAVPFYTLDGRSFYYDSTSLAHHLERLEAKHKKQGGVKVFETLVDDNTVEPVAAGSVRSNFNQPTSSKLGNNMGSVFSKPRNRNSRSENEAENSGSNHNYESSRLLQGQAGFYRFHMDIFEGSCSEESLLKLSNKLFEILGYLWEELAGTQIAYMGELAIDLLMRTEDRANRKSARKIAKNIGSARNVVSGLSKMEIPFDSRVESINKEKSRTQSRRSRSKSDSY